MAIERIPEQLGPALERVGEAALDSAGDADASLILYAELDDDMIQTFMRYRLPGEPCLRCTAEFDEATDAIRDAWELSRAAGGRQTWRAIVYRVVDRTMHVDLLYDEHVDDRLTLYDKEERLLARHFPGVEVIPDEPDPDAIELRLAPRRPFWKIW